MLAPWSHTFPLKRLQPCRYWMEFPLARAQRSPRRKTANSCCIYLQTSTWTSWTMNQHERRASLSYFSPRTCPELMTRCTTGLALATMPTWWLHVPIFRVKQNKKKQRKIHLNKMDWTAVKSFLKSAEEVFYSEKNLTGVCSLSFPKHTFGYGDWGPKSYPWLRKMGQNQTLDKRKCPQINHLWSNFGWNWSNLAQILSNVYKNCGIGSKWPKFAENIPLATAKIRPLATKI